MSMDSARDPAGLPPASASARLPATLRLDVWTVDTVGGVLQSPDKRVRLSRRANQVLCVLLRNPLVTVSREALLREVWRGAEIGDEVVTKAIREIRAAFGDETRERVIATVPRTGYRLMIAPEPIASMEIRHSEHDAPPARDSADASDNAHVVRVGAARATARGTVGVAILGIAIMGIAFTVWRPRASGEDGASLMHALNQQAHAVAASAAVEFMPDISPDGRRIAYSARADIAKPSKIYISGIDGAGRQRLTHDDAAQEFAPAWDATGQRIAYMRLTDKHCAYLVRTLEGGDVQRVANCGMSMVPAEFTHDGKGLIVPQLAQDDAARPQTWVRVDLGDGARVELEPIRRLPPSEPITDMRLSPDGKWAAMQWGYSPYGELFVVRTDLPQSQPMRIGGLPGTMAGLAWLPNSTGLLVATLDGAATLWHAPASTSAVAQPLGAYSYAHPRIATLASRAVFEHNAGRPTLLRIDLGSEHGDSRSSHMLASGGDEYFPTLSPDGFRLCFVSGRAGRPMLMVADRDHQNVQPIFQEPVDALGRPAWSADGQWLGFAARIGERWTVRLIRENGSEEQTLAGDWDAAHHVAFSNDGRWVYFDARVDGQWQVRRRERSLRRLQAAADAVVATDAYMPTRMPGSDRLLVLQGNRHDLAWLEVTGGTQTLLSNCGFAWHRHAWAATQAGLYCVLGDIREDFALYRQAWSGTSLERLADVPRGLPLLGLSVSERDDVAILGKRVAGADANIVSVELAPRN